MKDQRIFAKFGSGCSVALALLVAGCASTSPAPVIERGSQPAVAVQSKAFYTVKKGDTLYSIALDHGLDYKELVALNHIENANRIQVGQPLRIRAPDVVLVEGGAVTKPITTMPSVESRSLDAGVSSTGMLKREPKAGKDAYSEQALAQAQAQGEQQTPVEPAVIAAEKPEIKTEQKPVEAITGTDEFVWIWPVNGKMIGTFSEGASKGIDIAGKAGDPVLSAGDGKVVYSGTGLRGYGKLVIVKHNATYLSAYAHNQNILVKEGQAVSKGQKIAEMGNTDADQVKLHFEVRRQGKPVDPLKYLPQR